ncbi:MAG: response regulator [Deltaproteobacteria bacterium]|nr:MAG: response regulator [Deltaproteobacteria bacterium]
MSAADRAGATVLVVDDESGITAMLADRLSFAGYRTLVAESAERAMSLVRARCPDVILTDLYMPNVDGAEFIRRLRDEGYDVPVIVMSAGIEGEIAAIRAQATAFLEKPFHMNRAVEAVDRALGIQTES